MEINFIIKKNIIFLILKMINIGELENTTKYQRDNFYIMFIRGAYIVFNYLNFIIEV